MITKRYFADIGNSNFHIYDGEKVEHLTYNQAMRKYASEEVFYISVNHSIDQKIADIKKWKNISSHMMIQGEYETMGVDRKALCLSHKEGIFIDAGSAITVDLVVDGKYMGGFILPGLKAYLASYKSISPALETNIDRELSCATLPTTTKEQISYGIIASIKLLIEKHSNGYPLYFTGGDGAFLSTFFEDADYDETLVFKGMQKALSVVNH